MVLDDTKNGVSESVIKVKFLRVILYGMKGHGRRSWGFVEYIYMALFSLVLGLGTYNIIISEQILPDCGSH